MSLDSFRFTDFSMLQVFAGIISILGLVKWGDKQETNRMTH